MKMKITKRTDEPVPGDHKARVRASMEKIRHIHRAALKELADGATPKPPPKSPGDKP